MADGDRTTNEIVSEQHHLDRQQLRQSKSNFLKAKQGKREYAENKLRAYMKLMSD